MTDDDRVHNRFCERQQGAAAGGRVFQPAGHGQLSVPRCPGTGRVWGTSPALTVQDPAEPGSSGGYRGEGVTSRAGQDPAR